MSDVKPGQRVPRDRPSPSSGRSGPSGRAEGPGRPERPDRPASRPLAVTGLVAAAWCVGIGLAVLTTVTLVGWIAAPRTALGPGLPGVFRTAVNFWLVAHHAGFSLRDGRVGLLPLGLAVLPGALLYRSGGWMIRAARLPRPAKGGRGAAPTMASVVQVALALAVPYAVLAALLALAASTTVVRPSAWQALPACLVVAAAAGGLGAARALGATRGKRVRSGVGALLRLLPERPRSLVIGVLGALGVLVASGAVLVGASLAMHLPQATALFDELAPGVVGGILLLVVEVAYLPNAVIWGMAYAIGPGFAVGTGTSVSPTGVFLDMVPSFPPLAALPEPGPAPAVSLVVVAAPFLAGVVAGILTVRAMPSPVHEAAPLWGFLSGAMTGAVAAVLAALSGGPLGGGRLTVMGPSPWRVGLMAALEVGIAAAITAWLVNWRVLRRSAAGSGPAGGGRTAWRRKRSGGGEQPETKEPPGGKEPAPAGRRKERSRRRAPAAPAPAREPASPPPAPRPPRRSPVVVAEPVEFEEAEPVLTPRKQRRPRVREPLENPASQEPPADRGKRRSRPAEPEETTEAAETSGHTQTSGPAQTSAEAETVPDRPEPPRRRDEPERTETRGGAIYVLRDEPPSED